MFNPWYNVSYWKFINSNFNVFDFLFAKEDVYVYYWSWGTERVSCNNGIFSWISWVYYCNLDRKNFQENIKVLFILILYQWKGQNWMVGGNFQTSNRGIESDDLEFNFINNSWCVTDINLTQVPFRYLNYNILCNWDCYLLNAPFLL